MKIDKALNLVVPVDTETGTIYVHSMPIGREVFERYALLLAKTFVALVENGLANGIGARIAMLLLKQTAETLGVAEDVQRGLIPEIERLTNVVAPGPNGWETIPFREAINRKIVDQEDATEVENALAFFTVVLSMLPRSQKATALAGAVKLFGARIDSLNCTELAQSLPTSTATGNTGASPGPSPIPV